VQRTGVSIWNMVREVHHEGRARFGKWILKKKDEVQRGLTGEPPGTRKLEW